MTLEGQSSPVSYKADSGRDSQHISHHVLIEGVHPADEDDETLLALQHLSQTVLSGVGGGGGDEEGLEMGAASGA